MSVGENTAYDILGTTERLDLVVDEIFRRTGHSACPPPVHSNTITTAALRIKNVTNANCARLVAALDGAPDPIFDDLANRSVRDQALWKSAARRATARATSGRQPLPERPFAEPAFRWDLVQVPRNVSRIPPKRMPGWKAFHLLTDRRMNVTTLCLRTRVS